MANISSILNKVFITAVLSLLCPIFIFSPPAHSGTRLENQDTIFTNRIIQPGYLRNHSGNATTVSTINSHDDFISVLPDFNLPSHLTTDQAAERISDRTVKISPDGLIPTHICRMDSRNGYRIQVQIYQIFDEARDEFVNNIKITKDLDDSGNTLTFLEQHWVDDLGQWENYQKRTYQYDTEGNQIERIIYIWFGEQWDYPMKDLYSYDTQGRLTEWTQMVYNEGEWNNLVLFTYTYINDNLTEALKQHWQNGAWQLESRHVYFYDPNNILLEDYYQVAENDIWYNASLISYIYDMDNYLIEEIRFGWSEGHWEKTYKSIYTYDVSGNRSTWHTLIWDDELLQWVSNTMNFYYYNENDLVSVDSCQWYRNGAWGLHGSNSYEYDEFNRLSEILSYYCCSYPHFQKKSYFYDAAGNQLEISLQGLYYDVWRFMDRYIFTYGCGDVNNNGQLELLDITFLILYLYLGGDPPDNPESADLNGDGIVNIMDITSLIYFIYLNGPDPLCR